MKITYTAKSLFIGIIILICSSFHTLKHPYYVSVVDIKYSAKEKTLQLSIRMFTNDIEDALKKTTKKSVDLLNPKNKADMDSVLFNYIKQRLSVTLNSKSQKLNFIGYEKEEEAIWSYLEISKAPTPKTIKINAKLLYDFLPQQIIIFHTEINDIKNSIKITNPESEVEFKY